MKCFCMKKVEEDQRNVVGKSKRVQMNFREKTCLIFLKILKKKSTRGDQGKFVMKKSKRGPRRFCIKK
jgi:hypothetical protein